MPWRPGAGHPVLTGRLLEGRCGLAYLGHSVDRIVRMASWSGYYMHTVFVNRGYENERDRIIGIPLEYLIQAFMLFGGHN